MGFMTYNLLHDTWLYVENTYHEGTYLPMQTLFGHTNLDNIGDGTIEQYIDGNLLIDRENWEVKKGWGCRLSAPGYMDCTEWSGVFETEKEAAECLLKEYGDQEGPEYMEDWEKELRRDYHLGGVIDWDNPATIVSWLADFIDRKPWTGVLDGLVEEGEDRDTAKDALIDKLNEIANHLERHPVKDDSADPIPFI